jgi:hypothetical protein
MGVHCQHCGYEKQPWHAMGTEQCLNCENLDFESDHKFYTGVSLLIGLMVIGSLISLYILADYW